MHMNIEVVVGLDSRVNEVEAAVVRRLRPADLERPTPCAGWTVAELLEHMTAQHHGFAAAARGGEVAEEVWRPKPLGSDPVAAHAASIADVGSAFAVLGEDDLMASPEPGFGPFPAGQAVAMHLVDGVVHGWDVARALGVSVEFDDEVLAAAWRVAQAVPDDDEFRSKPDAPFGPSVDVDEGAATLDRIVAALGRAPDWSAA